MNAGTLTYEKLMEAKREIEKTMADNRFLSGPLAIGGTPVYTTPQVAKLQLKEEIDVSSEFRTDFNAWLICRFGYIEPFVERGMAYYIAGYGVIMRPEEAAIINTYGV